MKTIKGEPAAQGDVLFVPIAALPAGARELPRAKRPIIAHSETGHNHEIGVGARTARLFAGANPMVCYLQATGPVEVEHMRSFDTHETLRLLCGAGVTWEIRRQREYTPEGWRRIED